MVVPWLALAAGSSALSGVMGQNSANNAISKRQRSLKRLYSPAFAKADAAGKGAMDARQQALRSIQGGYGQALKTIRGSERASEVSAMDQAQQALGAGTQQLMDRGFYDPESLTAARRGYTSDLTRALGEIASMAARTTSGLQASRGLAVAGAQGDIAQQFSTNFGMDLSVRDRMAGVLSADQPYAQDQSESIGWLFAGLSDLFSTENTGKLKPNTGPSYHGYQG